MTDMNKDEIDKGEIDKAACRARGNLLVTFTERRGRCNAFTIGWCAAFVQWGRIYVVQRAEAS